MNMNDMIKKETSARDTGVIYPRLLKTNIVIGSIQNMTYFVSHS